MRNNNHRFRYRPFDCRLSHVESIATMVDCCNGTQMSYGHGLDMLTPTLHKKVGFLAAHSSFNISANVRFGLEKQAESLMKIIEHLKNQYNHATSMSHVSLELNMDIGITERSERYELLNHMVHVYNLSIKEMEEGI